MQTTEYGTGTQGRGAAGGQASEGTTTRAIEQVTAKAPSQVWLWLAGVCIAGSATLYLTGRKQAGTFVGLWPLTFLIMGNYNKLVKQLGSR